MFIFFCVFRALPFSTDHARIGIIVMEFDCDRVLACAICSLNTKANIGKLLLTTLHAYKVSESPINRRSVYAQHEHIHTHIIIGERIQTNVVSHTQSVCVCVHCTVLWPSNHSQNANCKQTVSLIPIFSCYILLLYFVLRSFCICLQLVFYDCSNIKVLASSPLFWGE